MRGLAVAALLSTLSVAAAGQEADPVDGPVRVRVVSRADGLPRPGVLVHVANPALLASPAPADGWLRPLDLRLRLLQVGRAVRTDPAGEADILLPRGDPASAMVLAGPPFVGERLEREGELWVLRVDQLEPFSVQVVDAAGAPLARFPVALHALGRDLAVALTDDRGVAVLGMPPGHSARVSVSPAGWIGSHDSFPKVTTSLRRHMTRLVLPPFGVVRVRPVRSGEPLRARLQCSLHQPVAVSVVAHDGRKDLAGIELGPVAVGARLRGSLSLDSRSWSFATAGPTRAGECVVVDVETDPPRDRLALRVVGPGLGAARRGAEVTVHTDAGAFHHRATAAADGRLVVDPQAGWRGKRLLRVDLDALGHAAGAPEKGPPTTGWSASLSVEREFERTLLELGEVELRPHVPLVTGRVVDRGGKPVVRAEVWVEGEERVRGARRVGVFTDAAGGFAVRSPLLRGDGGEPLRVVVSVAGFGPEPITRGPLPLGQDVEFVVDAAPARIARPPGVGSVRAVVVDLDDVQLREVQLELVPAAGGELRARRPNRFETSAPGAPGVQVAWDGVPSGTYVLRATAMLGDELFRSAPFEVEAGEEIRDARLQALVLGGSLRLLALQVVDEEGVPLAGAQVQVRHAAPPPAPPPSPAASPTPRVLRLPPTSGRTTDGHGRALLTLREAVRVHIGVSAAGKRPVELTEIPDDGVVRLHPAGAFPVRVRGLPPDVPRARLAIWLRHVERPRLDLSTGAPLGEGDAARVPLPVAGAYHVLLLVVPEGAEGMAGSTVLRSPEPVHIGAGDVAPCELTLDEEGVAHLRALLAK